jgi:hypothetical protein
MPVGRGGEGVVGSVLVTGPFESDDELGDNANGEVGGDGDIPLLDRTGDTGGEKVALA